MMESVQHKLLRVRPPRVQITYDLYTAGAIINKELPFVIGIIADLSFENEVKDPYHERKFVFLDKENFTDVMSVFNPKVNVTFTHEDKQEGVSLSFKSIHDFSPLSVVQQIPFLKDLHDKLVLLEDLKVKACNSYKIMEQLNKFTTEGKYDLSGINFIEDNQKEYLDNLFKVFDTETPKEGSAMARLQSKIFSLNTSIGGILNQIMHSKNFQRIEGTWKGLEYLIKSLEIGENLKVRVFNATFTEIEKDLSDAMDFDQSRLFKLVYEEEYGTYGGHPYGYLFFDYYIRKHQVDFGFLHKFCSVMAAAHIPSSVGTDSSLFELASFTELGRPMNISKIFESPEMAKYVSFRSLDDARYVSLLLPRYMSRLPYGEKYIQAEGINFEEEIKDHEDFLWSNATYVYASLIGRSFSRYGWFSSIIGPENGGDVNDLPVFVFRSKEGDAIIKCPTEVAITDRREKELSSSGFISLCYCKDTDYAAFFSGQSSNKPFKYSKAEANANANLSARIQYMLNVSRFAHYIKCMMRDKIGTFSSVASITQFLNDWITQYVLLNDVNDQELNAKYPLKEAKVIVEENPNLAGGYNAVLFLKPRFQMEELTVSLRLVAKIPEGS